MFRKSENFQFRDVAETLPRARKGELEELFILSQIEMTILAYAALWPRHLGLPKDALSFHDNVIIDDLIQRGFLKVFENSLKIPAVYWSTEAHKYFSGTENGFQEFIKRNLKTIIESVVQQLKKAHIRTVSKALFQDTSVYMNWRPVSSVPIEPNRSIKGEILLTHVANHVDKYSIHTSELAREFFRAFNDGDQTFVNRVQIDRKDTYEIYSPYRVRLDGHLVFGIQIDDDGRSAIEEYISEMMSVEDRRHIRDINNYQNRNLILKIFDEDERNEIYHILNNDPYFSIAMTLSIAIAHEVEIVRLFSRTIIEEDRHSRATSEIFFLYSDRREAKNRRYYPRRIRMKLGDIMEKIIGVGTLMLPTFVARGVRPPAFMQNRLKILDPDYILRHDSVKVKAALLEFEENSGGPSTSLNGVNERALGDQLGERGSAASVSERVLTDNVNAGGKRIEEGRTIRNSVSDIVYNAGNFLNYTTVPSGKFTVWTAASKQIDREEEKSDEQAAASRQVNRDDVKSDIAIIHYRRIFFRKFELVKRRIDNMVKMRENRMIGTLLRLIIISIIFSSMTAWIFALLGIYFFNLLTMKQLLEVENSFMLFVMMFIVGIYITTTFLMFRIFNYITKYEMNPTIDLLRSCIAYCGYAETYSKCVYSELNYFRRAVLRCLQKKGITTLRPDDGADYWFERKVNFEYANFDKKKNQVFYLGEAPEFKMLESWQNLTSDLLGSMAPRLMFEQRLDGAKRKLDRYRYNFTVGISLFFGLMTAIGVIVQTNKLKLGDRAFELGNQFMEFIGWIN